MCPHTVPHMAAPQVVLSSISLPPGQLVQPSHTAEVILWQWCSKPGRRPASHSLPPQAANHSSAMQRDSPSHLLVRVVGCLRKQGRTSWTGALLLNKNPSSMWSRVSGPAGLEGGRWNSARPVVPCFIQSCTKHKVPISNLDI